MTLAALVIGLTLAAVAIVSITRPLRRTVDVLQALADGDLTGEPADDDDPIRSEPVSGEGVGQLRTLHPRALLRAQQRQEGGQVAGLRRVGAGLGHRRQRGQQPVDRPRVVRDQGLRRGAERVRDPALLGQPAELDPGPVGRGDHRLRQVAAMRAEWLR